MKKHQFKNLETGDIVRHKSSVKSFVVTANYGDRVTAVQSADLTNENEWILISKKELKKKYNK